MNLQNDGSDTQLQSQNLRESHPVTDKEQSKMMTTTKEIEKSAQSEEMEEELLDYDDDYVLTEQDKAEIEMYEKELENQDAQKQKDEMELIEKRIENRTEKLEKFMNFSEGATSNMINEENIESEGEAFPIDKQDNISSEKQKESDKEGWMLREVISQPAIAQRRSTRAGTQGNIQEKATMLKAARNEITGISKFTTFHSQSVDKLSKLANSCKIKLGNETEAHLAIDRLKAHEIANAAIIEAREKTKSKKT